MTEARVSRVDDDDGGDKQQLLVNEPELCAGTRPHLHHLVCSSCPGKVGDLSAPHLSRWELRLGEVKSLTRWLREPAKHLYCSLEQSRGSRLMKHPSRQNPERP